MAAGPRSDAILQLRKTVLLREETTRTDEQLLGDYLESRDEAAIAAIVQRHALMVWGVCRRVLRNFHDAEDAFQATFLVLVRRASSITTRELLANWLYGVAHQTALKARATALKRNVREGQVTEMPEPAVREQDRCLELQPLLDQELNALPRKYRTVILLCDLEGKTRKEAAELLHCPEGTVAGWLSRARGMLAKRLARHGLAVSATVLAEVLSSTSAGAVPTSLVSSAIQLSSGPGMMGMIPANVSALTEGVLKTMLAAKMKTAFAVIFTAMAVAVSCGLLVGQQPGQATRTGTQAKSTPEEPSKERKDQKALFSISDRLDDEPVYKSINSETHAAYQKLGAKSGEFFYVSGLFGFSSPVDPSMKGKRLPGFSFSFKELPEGKVPKLPEVPVLFGLSFAESRSGDTAVDDDGMSELKGLKNLVLLDLSNSNVTDAGLRELKDLPHLTGLNLSCALKIGDEGLKELKEFKNLTHLVIQGNLQMTDAGFGELKDLRNLTALVLANVNIGDEGLIQLKGLKKMTALYLGGKNVGDEGMKAVKEFHDLLYLQLGSTQVTDAGLRELKGLKKLKELNLYDTAISDDGLAELKNFDDLTIMDLGKTQVTDAGLKYLKGFKSLSALNLMDTPVTDAGMKELKECKSLLSLGISNTKVTDEGMKEFKDFKSLQSLVLWNTQVTDEGLKHIHNLNRLISIDLHNTQVTDKGVADLKLALPNLTIHR